MSAPSVVSVSPNPSAIDIVLGTDIVVVFDQDMDTSTINTATFSLTGPGETQFVSPAQLNTRPLLPSTSREYVNGTFAFTETSPPGGTILTFTPAVPLRPNVIYTVLLVGPGATANSQSITNLDGDTLDSNYQWTFTTGDLDITVPPPSSPLTPLTYPLDPSKVRIVSQVYDIGNDLSQVIVIQFPAPINTASVTAAQILLSLEAILNDPSVVIPTGITPTVVIGGTNGVDGSNGPNTITITLTGWPSS
jgi:hypothetical protein